MNIHRLVFNVNYTLGDEWDGLSFMCFNYTQNDFTKSGVFRLCVRVHHGIIQSVVYKFSQVCF